MQTMLYVFLGGGLGSLARFGLVHLFSTAPISARFPIGLLSVNLLGSLAIGLIAGVFSRQSEQAMLHPLLVIGFLGGFTTFSSFSLENANLFRNGVPWMAISNILISVIGGILLAAIGFSVTHRS